VPGGPKPCQSITTRKGGSPLHVLRVMRYSRPYLRYLYPGLICVVIVALAYSINILAVLPTIQVIADRQGIPAWVQQKVADQRYGLALSDAEADQPARIERIRGNRSLPAALQQGDTVVRADGQPLSSRALFEKLAYAADGQAVTLSLIRGTTGEACDVVLHAAPISTANRYALRAAAALPQEMTPRARMTTLMLVLATVFTIAIVGGVCRFFSEYLIALTAGRTLVAVRRQMYRRVLALPLSRFESSGISDLMSRFLQDSQEIYRGLNFVFAKSLREPLKAVFAFVGAMVIDWRITLITVTTAPIAALIIRQFGKIIRKANRRLLEGYGRMLASLEGALTGIRVVKGYTMENYERRHLHAVDQQMLRQQMRIERMDALSSPVFEIFGHVVAIAAIIYFANLMFDRQMEFSRFATLAAFMAAMFDPVRKMSSFYNRIQQANAAVDRVFEVIDLPDEHAAYATRKAMPVLEEQIEFRGVWFTYPSGDTPALADVNLTIRRGERIAFVGPNGSGKTTLLALLMRFYEPEKGRILFDGRDVRDYSIASLRRQMSLITQDTVIFADTIANNIAYGDERLLRRIVLRRRHPERNYPFDDGSDRVMEAAKAAYADEFIREKPQGYDTYVGEHGVTRSGGQKQRIAIARAILRNAPIFIFDEATSQIDSESEQKIHDAVERFLQDRTALIIAHRFSTIMQANRIVVMDRGRIVDVGSHEELLDRCHLYQVLFGTQIVDDAGGSLPSKRPSSDPSESPTGAAAPAK